MNERFVSMTQFKTCAVAAFAVAAAGVLPAQAQSYQMASAQPAPLYPYELQPGQSYAVEVAPGTYVIHRPSPARDYPYVRCVNGCEKTVRRPARHAARPLREPRRFDRPPRRNDPALIDELRTRITKKDKTKKTPKIKTEVIHTTKVVRDPPVVIEHRRVVEDPPRVIERRHYVDDAPRQDAPRKEEKRVIHAEAEVTILGPDRMSIRLFRKGDAPVGGRR
jgi:hypothetical protein